MLNVPTVLLNVIVAMVCGRFLWNTQHANDDDDDDGSNRDDNADHDIHKAVVFSLLGNVPTGSPAGQGPEFSVGDILIHFPIEEVERR